MSYRQTSRAPRTSFGGPQRARGLGHDYRRLAIIIRRKDGTVSAGFPEAQAGKALHGRVVPLRA